MTSKLKTDVLETGSGSGTIALNNQLSGMTSASVPAGSVLQVLSSKALSTQETTSTSWVDTNLSLSITPSATSSKIMIHHTFSSVCLVSATSGASFRIMRDSTSLHTPASGHQIYTDSSQIYTNFSYMELDSPSTTSAITYKIQVRTHNSNRVFVGDTRFPNTITLTEIKG